MTRKRTLALAIGTATTAALLAAAPAGAQIDEPPVLPGTGDRCVPDDRLDAARLRVLEAIDRRLATVEHLGGAVDRAASLTDAHRSTIDATLASTSSGLTDLRATVEAEDDGCELADEARSVVEDFRVYVVVLPQARVTIGGDRVAGVEPKLDQLAERLAQRIDEAAADGEDVTDAQAAHDAFVAAYEEAVATAAPIGDRVLALVAADWPEPAQPTLEQAREDLRAAVEDLRAARGFARDVVDALE